jgi:hypothetical protein
VLVTLTPGQRHTLVGKKFFPQLISGPFHQGLVVVFAFSAALAAIACVASLFRGPHELKESQDEVALTWTTTSE